MAVVGGDKFLLQQLISLSAASFTVTIISFTLTLRRPFYYSLFLVVVVVV
jgi:hypothetical protein